VDCGFCKSSQESSYSSWIHVDDYRRKVESNRRSVSCKIVDTWQFAKAWLTNVCVTTDISRACPKKTSKTVKQRRPCWWPHISRIHAKYNTPRNPPPRIATAGCPLNHLQYVNAIIVISINHGWLSTGLPDWFVGSIMAILHNRYTAVKTRPIAAHSTPLTPHMTTEFAQSFSHAGNSACLIAIPGK